MAFARIYIIIKNLDVKPIEIAPGAQQWGLFSTSIKGRRGHGRLLQFSSPTNRRTDGVWRIDRQSKNWKKINELQIMHLFIALLAAIAARQAHACSFEIASVTSTYLGKPWSNATIANNTYTPQQVVVGVREMRGCCV
jgi:hypothetical protein